MPDQAPKDRETKPADKPAAPRKPRAPRRKPLKDRLEEFFGSFALGFAAIGDEYSAEIVLANAGQLAESWDRLAAENPRVRETLEKMVEGGAWSGVVMASVATLIPIAARYGALPPVTATMVGAPMPPERKRKPKPPRPERNGSKPAGSSDHMADVHPLGPMPSDAA